MAAQISAGELLSSVAVFSPLDPQAMKLLEQRMVLNHYETGDYVCREGEEGNRMFLIADGELEVIKQGAGDRQVQVALLKAGEVAGEMSLLENTERSASLRAKGPADIWSLDKDTFESVLGRHPQVARNLLAHLSRRLRRGTSLAAQSILQNEDARLKVAIFDSKPYTTEIFQSCAEDSFALHFYESRLNSETVSLAAGFDVVCAFVNDRLDKTVIAQLAALGVGMIALRCAGYNNLDLEAAHRHGISVVRVPAYSPYAVAEHAAALMLTLNRKIHRAYNRVREGNFSLNGLVGFDLHGRTAGVIGVGKIGRCLVKILVGFGMEVLGFDRYPDEDFARHTGMRYTGLDELLRRCDVISLHAPLLPETHHMVNAQAIEKMKPGVMLINTSRGALIDAKVLIEGLKSGHIGAAGLDVYEEEEAYFFEDFSSEIITDDVLARLMTFSNVVVTGHQGFLTREALHNIAETTFDSIREFRGGKRLAELTHGLLPDAGAAGGRPAVAAKDRT